MYIYGKYSKILNTKLRAKNALTNRADPDQTATEEKAVWSGSLLFASLTHIL